MVIGMGLVVGAIFATVASFVFGMLWYGPFFGKQWMKLVGVKKKDMKPAPKPFVAGFIRTFITAIIIANIFNNVDMVSALFTVTLLWVAFTAMPALAEVIWVKRPTKLYAINVLYELGSFVIITGVLVLWP